MHRLDQVLVERGLCESREKAKRAILAGQVRINEQLARKPSDAVKLKDQVTLVTPEKFVSRGGLKLEHALDYFQLDVAGLTAIDLGASTGGFTDCLLQHGAVRVYAIDVGKGLLHWKLRTDPRLVVMEQTNARYIERLPEPVALVVIDASFISLRILLPVVRRWITPAGGEDQPGTLLALIKPQFEAGRQVMAKNRGVIRDPAVHLAVLRELLAFCQAEGYAVHGLLRSPVLGPKGNIEFLAWLEIAQAGPRQADLEVLIGKALAVE
jgi:23S rRNA (cytidine1920-2'-O)/16S rRNA (cytidine1409-2'-O)-methyltransferase